MSLIRTSRGWIEPAPTHCVNGHELDRNSLVGWQQCTCGRGHRTHTCKSCGVPDWTPELGDTCEARNFDGR